MKNLIQSLIVILSISANSAPLANKDSLKISSKTLPSNSSNRHAFGGIGDGGGQGVVCRDDNGTVLSATLLDIFEAKNYFLLNIVTPSKQTYLDIATDYAAYLDSAIPSNDPSSEEVITVGGTSKSSFDVGGGFLLSHLEKSTRLKNEVQKIDQTKMLVPIEASIPTVGDSTPRVLPTKKGCQIEQIALYVDGVNEVRFSEIIWMNLSETDKAALLIHEALYKQLRQFGDTNSDRTRKIVAHLFGGTSFQWIFNDVPESFLSCWTTDSAHSFHFVVHSADTNSVTAQFLTWNGEAVMSKTATRLPRAPFSKIFGPQMPIDHETSYINDIKNPLLDLNSYSFTYSQDEKTKEVKMFFQTAASSFDYNNDLEVLCKKDLTRVVFENGELKITLPGDN